MMRYELPVQRPLCWHIRKNIPPERWDPPTIDLWIDDGRGIVYDPKTKTEFSVSLGEKLLETVMYVRQLRVDREMAW